MESHHLLLAAVFAGVTRLLVNFQSIHFYRLHGFWILPSVSNFLCANTAVADTEAANAPVFYLTTSYLNYALAALFIALLFPWDLKSDPNKYFSLAQYSIRLKKQFYGLMICSTVFYLPARYLFSDSFSVFMYDVLVCCLLCSLYFICIKTLDSWVHWLAFFMTIAVQGCHLFIQLY